MNNMPDEVRNKIEEKYQSFFWTDEQFGFTNESPVPKMQRNAATWGYSLASEEISRLKAENERLRGALSEIVSLISYMQKRLKEGEQLNGTYAIKLADDANYLRDIAANAIK